MCKSDLTSLYSIDTVKHGYNEHIYIELTLTVK